MANWRFNADAKSCAFGALQPSAPVNLGVEGQLLHVPTGRSWPIPESDQAHTSFFKTAAPLMGRNVTVGEGGFLTGDAIVM